MPDAKDPQDPTPSRGAHRADVAPAAGRTERIRLRACLEALPHYVPGRPPAPDGRVRWKASSNESPFPPLVAARDAAIAAIHGAHRYPDMGAVALREALASSHGVAPEQIVVSTGSSAVLGDLMRATVDPGDEVVFAWRSFEAYPIAVGSHGGVCVQVPLTDSFEHDLPAMAAAITPRTRLVLLCTPNNPTGASLSTEQLRGFLAQVPEDVVVGIDEAYREFHGPATLVDTAELFREHPNTVLLRTFSKLQGLAGLRIGYAVAHPRLAAALGAVSVPFGASLPAQAAALASLEPEAVIELGERARWIRAERDRIEDALIAGGWEIPRSQGNFVYLPLGELSGAFAAFAEERGLIVRAYGADGVRVTVCEREANDLLIEIAAAWRERAED